MKLEIREKYKTYRYIDIILTFRDYKDPLKHGSIGADTLRNKHREICNIIDRIKTGSDDYDQASKILLVLQKYTTVYADVKNRAERFIKDINDVLYEPLQIGDKNELIDILDKCIESEVEVLRGLVHYSEEKTWN